VGSPEAAAGCPLPEYKCRGLLLAWIEVLQPLLVAAAECGGTGGFLLLSVVPTVGIYVPTVGVYSPCCGCLSLLVAPPLPCCLPLLLKGFCCPLLWRFLLSLLKGFFAVSF
jgi:hypothetical protein